MFKMSVLILFLIHILGDFYFQSNSMAERKRKKFSGLVTHSFIYLLVAVIICIPVFSGGMIIAALSLSVCHFIIDFFKFLYLKKTDDNMRIRKAFIMDQMLHILSIFIIGFIFILLKQTIKPLGFAVEICSIFHISIDRLLCWILLILLMWKPANITIKKLLSVHKPDSSEEISKSDSRAGAFIGILERIIIIILLAIQQYAAIGLVLTAKSIARYSKISEDKEFGEYYLLGTLLSTAMALIAYLAII